MSNRLEKIINLKLNNFEIVPPKKESEYVDYPWDKCVADQIERYGDEEIAKKVCGAIKAGMKSNFAEGDDLEGACWEGYEPIGLKPSADGSRMVPNCVPIKENQAKEKFVIPSPEGGEDQDTYIGRCVKAIIDEYGQEQALGICYSQWEKK